MKRTLLVVVLCLVSASVFAKSLYPTVRLLKIEAVKAQEQGGDELYLHLTEYRSDGKSSISTFPARPTYWPSEHLDKVKNVKIWDSKLNKGESVEVIISLLEQDFHPWNTDDLVGTIKLRIKNNNDKLESNWSMPNRADAPDVVNTKHGLAQRFTLIGDNFKYVMYMLLAEGDKT